MFFKDIVGQDIIKEKLVRSVKENRVSHAQMFIGTAGAGTLPLALAYAQYINCENPRETDSCGSCPSCLKSTKLIHPDIHFSYPFISIEKQKKVLATDYINEWRKAILEKPYLELKDWQQALDLENQQLNIPIKECAEINRKLSLKTFESSYKILVIWLPEFLGKEGNTLLKLIEEPPDKTLFLLVAENQEKIINTIISRTQITRIPRLQDDEIARYMVENHDLETPLANELAPIAEGDINRAAELAKQAVNEFSEVLQKWLRASFAGIVKNLPDEVRNLNTFIDEMSKKGREQQKNFLKYALHFFREMLLYTLDKDLAKGLTAEEKEFAVKFERYLNAERIETIAGLLDRSIYYIERNANQKILLLNLSIQIAKVLSGKMEQVQLAEID